MVPKKRKLKPTRKMPFRRRREGKTDYKRRLALLKSRKPRLVIRKSLKYIRAQIIEFDEQGDKTIVAAGSNALPRMGWKFACDNIPAAYLTGLMTGRAAKRKKINNVVLDIGLYSSTKGSKLYAVVKGAIDAGLNVSCNAKIFPDEERISGKHIAAHDKNNKKSKELSKQFEKIKGKILGEIDKKVTKDKKDTKGESH